MTNFNPPSPTFCALPWMHLSTRPDGSIRVCCTANASSVGATNDKEHGGQVGVLKLDDGKPANLNTTTLLDAWNNTYMKTTRKMMLAGEKPASCLKCYNEEAAGHASKRQWETRYWSERVDLDDLIQQTGEDGSVAPSIRYVDLRLGTKCNLACVMCSPHDSSLWIKDWQKLYPTIENDALKETMVWDNKGKNFGASYNWHKGNPEFWSQLYDQIPNMEQLYFAGGEPLIIDEHYDILEEVVRRGHAHKIELRYNSNGVEMPERVFDLWAQFKRVRFHYSIDSIGEMNDYIRYPSKWDHQVQQFWKLDNTEANVEVTVACAVQALNIYYIPDLVKWKLSQGFKKINPWPLGAGTINFHHVYHPPHLNCRVLPPDFKAEVAEKYDDFSEWLKSNWQETTQTSAKEISYEQWENSAYGLKRYKGLVSFMNAQDWSNRMPEFQEYMARIDALRGLDAKTIFPEMAKLFK